MNTVTIIIPMYNAADHIARAIHPILSSEHRDMLELIIVDDGSTDDSGRIAANTLDTSDNSISYKIIRQTNCGVSGARNAGLDAASGSYIIFCDSDDEFTPDFDDLLSLIYDTDKDLITWPFLNEDNGSLSPAVPADSVRPGTYDRDRFLKMHLTGGYKLRLGSFAVKRSIIEDNTIRFNEGCTLGEDVEFFMKALLHTSCVSITGLPCYIYHRHQGSLASSYNLRRFEAPRAMERVAEYINNSPADSSGAGISPLSDDLYEYICNGLYILHTVYSLDSCISHISSSGELKKFLADVMADYPDVVTGLRIKLKNCWIRPYGISWLRLTLLKAGIPVYARYVMMRRS